jgi:hypothetical protein
MPLESSQKLHRYAQNPFCLSRPPPPFSASKILIPRTPIPRHISYVIVLQHRQNFVRQRAHDLDRVDARQVRAQALPLGDPGGGGVADGDERVEDSGCAFGDGVGRVL